MKRIICYIIVLALFSSTIYAGGFASLKMGADARASALGMASVASPVNGAASFWNPAGVPLVSGRDLVLTVNQWIQDVKSGFVGFASGNKKHGIGIHLLYTSVPDIEYRTGPTEVPVGTFTSSEMMFGVSYGWHVLHDMYAGIGLKGYYEKIFYHEAWGFGGDLGILWHPEESRLSAGLSLQNLGRTGALNKETIELPLTLRGGLSFAVLQQTHSLNILVDGVQELDSPFHLQGGVEYLWQNRIAIRAGYQSGFEESRSITGGLGIIQGRFQFDYGYIPFSSGLGDAHQLTLGIKI